MMLNTEDKNVVCVFYSFCFWYDCRVMMDTTTTTRIFSMRKTVFVLKNEMLKVFCWKIKSNQTKKVETFHFDLINCHFFLMMKIIYSNMIITRKKLLIIEIRSILSCIILIWLSFERWVMIIIKVFFLFFIDFWVIDLFSITLL